MAKKKYYNEKQAMLAKADEERRKKKNQTTAAQIQAGHDRRTQADVKTANRVNNSYTTSPKGISQSTRSTATTSTQSRSGYSSGRNTSSQQSQPATASYAQKYAEQARKRKEQADAQKAMREARIAQRNGKATETQKKALKQSSILNKNTAIEKNKAVADARISQKNGTLTQDQKDLIKTDWSETAEGAVKRKLGGHLTTIGDLEDMFKADIQSEHLQDNMGKLTNKDDSELVAKQRSEYAKKLTDEGSKQIDDASKGATGLKKAALAAEASGIEMLMDQALGSAWWLSMASSSYGNALGEVERQGGTKTQDRLNAGLQALKEVGTEYLFTGAGIAKKAIGGKGLLSPTEKLADRISGALTNKGMGKLANASAIGVKTLGGTIEENIEEFAGWALDPVIANAVYGNDLQAKNEQTARTSIQSQSQALRDEVMNMSPDEVNAVIANLNSDQYLETVRDEYIKNGAPEEQATALAEQMRDYLAASISGDDETASELENAMVNTFTGGENSVKKTWDFGELAETLQATTLLTMVTGAPGAAIEGSSLSQTGSILKGQLGVDGVKALTKTAMNVDDESMSIRAQAMRDAIESGKELSDYQVGELARAQEQQIQIDTQRQDSAFTAAQSVYRSEGNIDPFVMDGSGGIVFADKTAETFKETKNTVLDNIKDDDRLQLSEEELDNVSTAITGYKTGVLTVGMANEMMYDNQGARTAFEEETGETLPVVRDRKGNVDITATNVATKEFLFKNASKNLVKTAEAETIDFRDRAKGQIDADAKSRMGTMGQQAFSEITDNLDVINSPQYIAASSVASTYYAAGRNGGFESFEALRKAIGTQLDGYLSEADIRKAYDAGVADREIAENNIEQKAVKIGEAIDNKPTDWKGNGTVINEVTSRTLRDSEYKVFEVLAHNLGVTIHLVDNLNVGEQREDGTFAQANGEYINGEIWLNINGDPNMNIGYVFMHEVTHHIKAYAPTEFAKLENLVRANWSRKNPVGMQRAIKERIDLYAKHGQTLTEEAAIEEIIADSTYEMLQDREFVAEACEDLSLGRSILNAIRFALKRLRAMFAEYSDYAPRYNEALLSQLGILKETEQLWLDGLNTAMRNQAYSRIDAMARGEARASVADSYSYNSLVSMPDMIVADSSKNGLKQIGYSSTLKRPDVYKVTHENIKKHNDELNNGLGDSDINNRYIGTVHVGNNGLRHAFRKFKNNISTRSGIAATINLPDVLENAIPINEAEGLRNNASSAYILIGAIKDGSKSNLVRIAVNSYTKELESVNSLYAVNAKKEDAVAAATRTSSTMSSSKISIADLLDITRNIFPNDLSEDVANHYGYTRGKSDLDRLKYSISPEQDAEYIRTVTPGTDTFSRSKAQEMVDRAAQNAGYNIKGWHGTDADFTVFDKSNGRSKFGESGFIYLTTDEEYALMYAYKQTEEGEDYSSDYSMGLYAKANKPLEIGEVNKMIWDVDNTFSDEANKLAVIAGTDANTLFYDVIGLPVPKNRFHSVRKLWEAVNTPEFAKYIEDNGYDSIHATEGGHEVYGVINPEQVKSADFVVRDDNGKTVPLSKRFNTESTDIRYSIPEQDAAYMEAVNNGDMETAQRMVDERAEELGYVHGYHGTSRAGFLEFNNQGGSFKGLTMLTTSKVDADSYAGENNHSRLFDPEEKQSDIEITGGSYYLGDYLRFDSEEDRAEFLKNYPNAESYIPMELLPDSELDEDAYDDAKELAFDIERAYRGYENSRTHVVTGQDIYDNVDEYSKNDIIRLLNEWDDEVGAYAENPEESDKDYWVEVLKTVVADEKEQGLAFEESILSLPTLARVKDGETRTKIDATNISHRTYGLYVKLENPIVVDYHNKTNEFNGDFYQHVEELKEDQDHDGLIAKNLRVGRYKKPGNVYVVKEGNNNIALANPVTYDETGKPIPLSQRFDQSNNNIKYSLPAEDSEGKTLSNEQREYFGNSKIVDEQGRLVPVYHGSRNSFTIFDLNHPELNGRIHGNGFYFAYSEDDAEGWANGDMEDWDADEEEYDVEIYKVYLNITNPYILNGERINEDTIRDELIEQGYDGIIVPDYDEVIAFYPEQIKLVDNTDPTNNPDIRYSITSEDDMYDWISNNVQDADLIPTDNIELEEGRMRLARSKKEAVLYADSKWNERWYTGGKFLDVKSVEKNIRNLVMGAMANSDTTKQYKTQLVNNATNKAKAMYWHMKEGNHQEAANIAWDVAKGMVENVDFIEDTAFRDYKGLRDYLRTTKLTLSDNLRSDIDYNSFRKQNMGRIRLANDGTPVYVAWVEMCEQWPEWFKEDVLNPADQLMVISDVLDAIQPYRVAYSSEEATALIGDIADSLFDIVQEGKEYESIADTFKKRFDKQTKALKERHQEAKKAVAEYNFEQGKKAGRKEGAKAQRQKQQSAKERAKTFGHIQTNYDWLSKRLLSPTKEKNIPEQFRTSLAHMLQQFDFQTERSKALEEKYGPAQKTIKMRELKDRLAEISKEDETGEFIYNGYLFNLMDAMANRLDGKSVDAMETADLIGVDEMLKCIRHSFENYAYTIAGEKQREIKSYGESAIKTMFHKIETVGRRKVHGDDKILSNLDRLLNEGEETPVYFFERLGGGIYDMYKQLRKGEDKYIENVDYIKSRIAAITGQYQKTTKHGIKKSGSELEDWRSARYSKEFVLKDGTITMSVAQMMSLYCHSKRAQSMGHITGNGIVVSTIKDSFASEEKVASTMITYDEVNFIISQLTPEQIKMADEFQALMNNEMSAWGNETSMKMYGVKLFREQNYFPIKSSGQVLAKTADSFEQAEKIKNFGFTKETVKGANNAIVIDDIFHVVAEHCNSMALYNALAAPITDFMRVYNYKHTDEDSGKVTTVQEAIGEAYTNKANNYIMKFISDVNGATKVRSDAVDDIIKQSLAAYKKAAIAANIRVLLQQPTAIFRSLMLLDPKYFKGQPFSRADMNEMFEHCPIAKWKSWGNYEMDLGRDMESQMMNTDWSWSDRLTMGTYGMADNMTWTCIWNAVKREVEDKNPKLEKGSKEYWDKVNERASEVFDKTQVVDSIFHRSDTMRSKQTFTKVMTSFMAEPTLTYNVMRSALVNARDELVQGNKKAAGRRIAKMVVVLALNAGATSAMAAIADVIRGKNPDGDDDEELTTLQLWFKNFLNNFGDNANPLNQIYFVKDIISLFDGWGTSNMALEGWETLINGFVEMNKYVNGESKKTFNEICGQIAGGFGYVMGYPIKTILRDADAMLSKFGIDMYAYDLGLSSKASSDEDKVSKKTQKKEKSSSKSEADVATTMRTYITKEEFNAMVEDDREKIGDLTGREREEKIWDVVSDGYTKALEAGDVTTARNMLKEIQALGGDVDAAREKMATKSKTALKKTIGDEGEWNAQQKLLMFMKLELGITDQEISEVCYKSETTRDLKAAMMLGDEDAIKKEVETLVWAGLSREDFDKAYKNRTRMKDYDGKYSDRLKSSGVHEWPVTGALENITSQFGYRSASSTNGVGTTDHQGVDIGVPTGTEVGASDGGIVKFAGWSGGYGNLVIVQHDNGSETYYAHLSQFNCSKGDAVQKGQTVALSGSTGNSTGPHLHFGVKVNGSFVNPLEYLSA